MKYFGVPICPYCKKRVNLIRTWSLKKQGEYQCPRCGGISNIYLSPLIYVFALLAVFAGGAMYFFHKFILNDVSLTTVLQVLIPFAVFFAISLFMVYLEKPVIKKVPRAEIEKKKRRKKSYEEQRYPSADLSGQSGQLFYDADEYVPQIDYRTGPMPIEEEGFTRQIPSKKELEKASASEHPTIQRREAAPRKQPAASAKAKTAAKPAKSAASSRKGASVEHTAHRTPKSIAAAKETPAPVKTAQPQKPAASTDDFFAKYNDPEYVERRLRELNEKRNGKS